jgi:hypothetical protein
VRRRRLPEPPELDGWRQEVTEPDDGANYCPKGAILVYASGRVRPIVRDCDRWACSDCAASKARAITARAIVAAGGVLYAGEVPEADWKAAIRSAQRQGCDRLSIRWMDGGGLLVATRPLSGRSFTWSLQRIDRATLVAKMLSRRIRRHDWSESWRPDPKPTRLDTDELVSHVPIGPKRIDEVLATSGVVRNGKATVGPAAAAARIMATAYPRRRPSEHFWTRPA